MGTSGRKLCVLLFGNSDDFSRRRSNRDDKPADSGSSVSRDTSHAADHRPIATDEPQFFDRPWDVQSPRLQPATNSLAHGREFAIEGRNAGIVPSGQVAIHEVTTSLTPDS